MTEDDLSDAIVRAADALADAARKQSPIAVREWTEALKALYELQAMHVVEED